MADTQHAGATLRAWDDIEWEQLSPLIERKLVTGERVMLAHVLLHKDAHVPRHSHDNEQFTYILKGALRFTLGENGEEEVIVREGQTLHIPPNLPHEAWAIEETLDMDVFSPPRQDWLDKTDDYLRGDS